MAVTSIYPTITPPIVPDMEPAFLKNILCKIYFSFSAYNNKNDIKNVQVSVVNQQTNKSVLDETKYPTGIKLISGWSTDDDDSDKIHQEIKQFINDYPYYINIYPTDLRDGFKSNTIYKVQLRFTHINAGQPPDNKATAEWLNNNINYFSEWSKVCLIKGINQPIITINEMPTDGSPINQPLAFTGRLSYLDPEETENLKSYNINIINTVTNKSVLQSEEVYTNPFNPNEINYQLLYDLQSGINYQLIISYITNNLYEGKKIFNFSITDQNPDQLTITLKLTPEESNGSIKINILYNESNIKSNLIIRRASSKTNFLRWENIKTISHNPSQTEYLWYDTSIQSGIWYKYRIQEETTNGAAISQISQPIMCLFEDIFLTHGNKQLKIQFNPSVSDFKYNVAESQQVTLGAQYPYVKRNGNNYYRTFSIGGLISALMDQIYWYSPSLQESQFYNKNSIQPFTTSNELFGDAATDLYDEYNQTNNIHIYQDYVYERHFRQKVMQFLYENNIKLFRSLTEGNILVKLTNIALQPIDTLGRRLYSFSATAIEINNNTLENLKTKYNLINKKYYTYASHILESTIKSHESLINKFYEETAQSQNNTNVIKLIIKNLSQDDDIIVYAKSIKNKNFIKYTIAPSSNDDDESLQIYYSDADPIEQVYFQNNENSQNNNLDFNVNIEFRYEIKKEE